MKKLKKEDIEKIVLQNFQKKIECLGNSGVIVMLTDLVEEKLGCDSAAVFEIGIRIWEKLGSDDAFEIDFDSVQRNVFLPTVQDYANYVLRQYQSRYL